MAKTAAPSPAFADLLERLRTVSRRRGERALAGALSECATGVSRDLLDCPLGAMLLDEYRLSRGPGRCPIIPDRERLERCVRDFLDGRARLAADAVYVDAILACAQVMSVRRTCPVYRALDAGAGEGPACMPLLPLSPEPSGMEVPGDEDRDRQRGGRDLATSD